MLLLILLTQPSAHHHRQKAEDHQRGAAENGVLGREIRIHFLKVHGDEAADDGVAPGAKRRRDQDVSADAIVFQAPEILEELQDAESFVVIVALVLGAYLAIGAWLVALPFLRHLPRIFTVSFLYTACRFLLDFQRLPFQPRLSQEQE